MLQLKKYRYFIFWGMILFFSCNNNDGREDVQKDDLELIASYEIDVSEPSGLAINNSGTALYTVSDNTAKVYKLSTTGNVIKTFGYLGNDLEGVSTFTGTKLLLAEERARQIVAYDMGTGHTIKHRIDIENNDDNSGIEGVAYADNLNAVFILNEKNPGKLIRLRSDFSIIAAYDLNFAVDYSGIFHESSTNNLWILSDQNKTLNKCTLRGDLIKSYSISITQAEGIAISEDKIYVVSDTEEKLFIYKKPLD